MLSIIFSLLSFLQNQQKSSHFCGLTRSLRAQTCYFPFLKEEKGKKFFATWKIEQQRLEGPRVNKYDGISTLCRTEKKWDFCFFQLFKPPFLSEI